MFELYIYNPTKTQPGSTLLRKKFRSVEAARDYFYKSEYSGYAYTIYDAYGYGVEGN